MLTPPLLSTPPSGPSPVAHWRLCGNQLKEDSSAELATSKAEEDIRCRRYKEGVHLVIHWGSLLVHVFNSCPCLSPGEPSLRKRSPEGALQDRPPAKRVVRCALTGSEGTVEALGVSSSAPVVSGGAVVAERSPPICEGELCGASPSVRLGWNRPCLSSLSPSPPLKLQQLFVTSVHSTTHAPHVSTLIPCNTERCGLVTVWSVQEA